MHGRDKNNFIPCLELAFFLPFEFPVCLVDEDQYAGCSGLLAVLSLFKGKQEHLQVTIVLHEKFCPWVLEVVLDEV